MKNLYNNVIRMGISTGGPLKQVIFEYGAFISLILKLIYQLAIYRLAIMLLLKFVA